MELDIGYDCIHQGNAIYSIHTVRRTKAGWPHKKDRPHLKALAPRITAMAKRMLGKHFTRLEMTDDGLMCFLHVKIGTAKAKWFEFHKLCGWIALFDAENEPRKRGADHGVVPSYLYSKRMKK